MLIPVLFAALVSASVASDCDKMRVPLCASMPYRETRLPNLYGHKTQDEVNQALEPLTVLKESRCFDDHSLLICSALAPPCLREEQVTPAPCRSACQRARDECFDTLLVLNITQAFPDCTRLPDEQVDPYCVIPTPRGEPTYFKKPYKELSQVYQEYDVLGSAPGKYTSHNSLSRGPWYPSRPVEHLPSFPITHKPSYGPRPTAEKRIRRSPAHKIVKRDDATSKTRTRSRRRYRSRTRYSFSEK